MHAQALLVQAKKQHSDGRLGEFTPTQEDILPARLDYTAILLYMYEAPDVRLAPFAWLCANEKGIDGLKADIAQLKGKTPKTLEDIRAYISATVLSSGDVIDGLSQGARGTSNERIIREQICPDRTPNVQIQITWRGGKPPKPPFVTQPLVQRQLA